MSNDLQDLNDGVSNSSQEIERVKKMVGMVWQLLHVKKQRR